MMIAVGRCHQLAPRIESVQSVCLYKHRQARPGMNAACANTQNIHGGGRKARPKFTNAAGNKQALIDPPAFPTTTIEIRKIT